MDTTTYMKDLRERSGDVESNSKLVSFLYELMRDHLPPGKVTEIVLNSQTVPVKFTNGWLARFAEDIAKDLE